MDQLQGFYVVYYGTTPIQVSMMPTSFVLKSVSDVW